MRTIKFRGKRINRNGEWSYGDLRKMNGICYVFPQDDTAACDRDVVFPATVGQFTGLLDKDGKEIYEGDILAVEGIPFGVVRWHEDGYFFIDDSTDEVIPDDTYRPLGEMIRFFNRNDIAYSVIGNIHDNPERWKGGNP